MVEVPTLERRRAMQLRPAGPPAMFQQWANLLFLHWKVTPEVIAGRLPARLHVDTFDGSAWLGVVPFFMNRIRPRCCPAVPGISWFLELNVRTYVFDDAGTPGVWFFSLDCNQRLAVRLARRFFHLAYHDARMSASGNWERGVNYSCQRTGSPVTAQYRYSSDGTTPRGAEPGTLEYFLVERYVLFAQTKGGELARGQVHHEPYRFTTARGEFVDRTPLAWEGFEDVGGGPVSALVSPGVDVEVFGLQYLR